MLQMKRRVIATAVFTALFAFSFSQDGEFFTNAGRKIRHVIINAHLSDL